MRPIWWSAALLVALGATAAAADPWTVTAEAGAQLDSNVQRVETGLGLPTAPVTTGLVRFGARVDHKGKIAGGSSALSLSDLTRIVSDSDVSVENVTVINGNARWLHPVADRPVLLGGAVTGTDALPLSDEIGSRTFRNLGADALLVLRGSEEHSLLLGAGFRDFVYKPAHAFDWRGPVANARLELVLWQPPSKTKSLELVAWCGFEARPLDDVGPVNDCAPSAPPDPR